MSTTNRITLLALFPDLDPAAQAIVTLRELGIQDDHMNIISGVPVSQGMLGRPHHHSNVPLLSLGGAVAGMAFGIFLAFGVPDLYPLNVGGQSLYPGPPSIVVMFEMTMLGMLLSTFLGVFLDSRFPSYEPKEYVPEISDGKIAILIECESSQEAAIEGAMTKAGAESVKQAEAKKL